MVTKVFRIIVASKTPSTKVDWLERREIWHLKWWCIHKCFFSQYNRFKLRKIYSLFPLYYHTNQCKRCSSIPETNETGWAKLDWMKRSEIWHFKYFRPWEWIITQLDRLQFREIYSLFHTFNHTNQWKWWCSTNVQMVFVIVTASKTVPIDFNTL